MLLDDLADKLLLPFIAIFFAFIFFSLGVVCEDLGVLQFRRINDKEVWYFGEKYKKEQETVFEGTITVIEPPEQPAKIVEIITIPAPLINLEVKGEIVMKIK